MITFPGTYVRLDIERNESPDVVTESLEHLLRVCRLNKFRRAVVVSEREEHVLLSALGRAVRYCGNISSTRLALVFPRVRTDLPKDIKEIADAASLECEVFRDEAAAIRWLGR